MPMLSSVFRQSTRAHNRASVFVIAMAMVLAFSQTVSAPLVQALNVSELSSEQVLGDTTYPSFKITSPTNQSLTVTATPLSFASGKWTYKFDWTRVRNAQGSVYITLKSNKSNKALSLDTADKTGSETAVLDPATAYRFEFYSQTGSRGTILLRKYFTTLVAPAGSTTWTGDTNTVTTTTTGTGTGSYDPSVDNKTTNTFYIAPKSQVKKAGLAAYYFVRLSKQGSLNSVISEFQNVPKGMNLTIYKINKDSMRESWYTGQDLPFDKNTDMKTEPGALYMNAAISKWLGSENRWLQVSDNAAKKFDQNPVILGDTYALRSGDMGVLKVDTDPNFTSGPGTYTITAVETTMTGTWTPGMNYNDVAKTQKKATFSIVVGDQLNQCLSDLESWPEPLAKSSKTLPGAFQFSTNPASFTDACDPSIGESAFNFPNFLANKKPLLQDCVNKAQKQAYSLGVPMTCSIIDTKFSTEPRFRAGCVLDGTGYEYQAAELVGTGYLKTNGWQRVLTDIINGQALAKGVERGYVYYDNDSSMWRAMNQTVADPPASCDKLLDVDVKSVNKQWNISIHAQTVVEGTTVPVEIVAPPSVKSVSLYLLKDYTTGSNAREWWNEEFARAGGGLWSNSWTDWNIDVNAFQSPFRNQLAYPEFHPQVALTMQRVPLVNGKATIQWRVPTKLDPLQDMGVGSRGSAGLKPPMTYSIRTVADNGLWSDSPYFRVLSSNQAVAEGGGTTSTTPADKDTVDSMTGGVWNGKKVLFRSFGVMGEATAPLDVYITGAKSTYAPGDQHPRGDDPYPITPGKQIQISGTMFNNGGTKKVDVDLLKINSGCTRKNNQIYSDFQICEKDSYATPEKIWSIASGVSSTIRVVTDPDGTNTWFFTYIFTIPSDAPAGRYIIRLVDPDFVYGLGGQERGSAVYDRQGGAAFSASFDVVAK